MVSYRQKSRLCSAEIPNPDYLGVMGRNHLYFQQNSKSVYLETILGFMGCNTSMISNYLTCSRKGIWDSYTLGSGLGRAVKQERELCLKFAIGYHILPSQLQSQKCDRTRLKHTSSNIFSSIMSIFTDSNKFCSFQNGERKLILQHQNMSPPRIQLGETSVNS